MTRVLSRPATRMLTLVAVLMVLCPGAVMAQAATDLVFLVDGSGSISPDDWQLQKDGISAALRDAAAFRLDGSVAVGVVQWSFVNASLQTRLELPLTILDGVAVRDEVINRVQGMGQLGFNTNPGDGIRAGTLELLARGRSPATTKWTLCMSTDGIRNSGEILAPAVAFAKASGVDKYSVVAIEDPPNFDADDFKEFYGPFVFGGGSVTVARNSIEFANLIIGGCLGDPVQLRALEVNQSAQNWRNSIRLVTDKPTTVRAFVEVRPGETPQRVVGRLFGTRGGSPLPESPLLAINSGSSILASPDIVPRRGALASSLNFSLPPSWLSGTVQLEFEAAGAPVDCQEPSSGGSDPAQDCTVTMTFRDEVEPEIVFVGVRYLDRDKNTVEPTSDELFEQMWRFRSILPIASIDYRMDSLSTFTSQPDLEDVNSALALKRFFDTFLCFVGCSTPSTSASRYYGVISGNGGGLANDIPGTVSSGFLDGLGARGSTGYARNRGPHEVAHNLGRHHAVDNSLGLDPQGRRQGRCGEIAAASAPGHTPFATVDGNVRPALGPLTLGPDEEVWGLDNRFVVTNTADLAVVDPSQTFDLMSYCGGGPQGRWISRFTYEGLMGAFPAALAGAAVASSVAPDQRVVVRGRINLRSDRATLDPLVELTGAVPPPLPGSYRVQLLDASGRELAGADFQPEVMEADAAKAATPTGPPIGLILVPLPKPAAPIARVVVRHNGVVIGERRASRSVPTVGIISPAGGDSLTGDEVTVSWVGMDADGGVLTYSVFYSHDGGTTWSTLAIDTRNQTLTLPRSDLRASESARLLVVVSDGVHTNSALSELFAVANNAPQVNIDRPRNRELFTGVQVINMEGTAFDREEGRLGGLALEWSSDRDGRLGGGASLSVNAANLLEGTHQLSLVARDADGLRGADTVTIQVFRIKPPLPQFTVIGVEGIEFGENTVVTGTSGSNETVTIGKAGKVVGDVFCNAVALREGAVVDGDVHCNVVNVGKNAMITGIQAPIALPIVEPLPPVSVSPGAEAVTVPAGGDRRLDAGSYRSIETGKASVLRFSGGQYDVGAIRIGRGTRLIFEGPTTVNVANHLDVGEDAVLAGVAGLTADDVRVNYAGSADVVFGKHVKGALMLTAPNAGLLLGEAGTYAGQIWAKTVRLGKGGRIAADE